MPWTELTGSRLDQSPVFCGNPGAAAAPNCIPFVLPSGGNTINGGIIDVWTSGCQMGDELILPAGGGHADWAGNQVLSFKPSATPKWTIKRIHSPLPAYTVAGSAGWTTVPLTTTPTYTDGTPASKHTYDTIAWMPTKNRIWCGGGQFWSAGGDSVPQTTWWLNPTDWSWTKKCNKPGGYGCSSGWDSLQNRLLVRLSPGLYSYNPDLEDAGPNVAAYSLLYSQGSPFSAFSSPLAIDSVNRRVYRLEPSGSTGLRMTNLNNLQAKEVQLVSTGDLGILGGFNGPGLIFDAGRLVALGKSTTAGKASIYTCDPLDKGGAGQPPIVWQRWGSGTEPPDQAHVGDMRGVWKRFFGPTSTGKYYFVNQWNETQWEYAPDWSATSHTVDEARGLVVEVTP